MSPLRNLLSRFVILILCSAVPASVSAQAWIAMDDGKGYRYELDAETVERITNGEYRVRWRWGREFVDDFSMNTLRVDCQQHKVSTERSVSINRPMYPSDPERQVFTRDFIEGNSISFWGTKPLSPDEKMRAVRFPTSGSPESRLVRLLCQNEPFFKQFHELTGDDLQKRWGCGTPQFANAPMCRPDLETRELLGQLIGRMDQVEKACALTSDDASLILRVWLKEVEVCRNASCDLSSLRIGVDGLGGDLSKAQAGRSCTFVASAVERARHSEVRDVASLRFTACLARTIPDIDDKVSPANVVAEGVYAACRGELTPDLASSSSFASTMLPSVTSQVLRARHESRKPSAKH